MCHRNNFTEAFQQVRLLLNAAKFDSILDHKGHYSNNSSLLSKAVESAHRAYQEVKRAGITFKSFEGHMLERRLSFSIDSSSI